jgi:hypothetical protein
MWLHEIKHDGFRVIARKDGDRARLYSRPGNDLTKRFPLIAEALTGLRSRSCIIDMEAAACDDNGLAPFERIRYRQLDGDVFDLIELNGDDLRCDPLQVRKVHLSWPRPAPPRYPVQRAYRRRRPDGLRPCLQHVALGSALPLRPITALGQEQESGGTSGQARSGGSSRARSTGSSSTARSRRCTAMVAGLELRHSL